MLDSRFLHLPKPCTADWSSMLPEERGRHCAICDKVVLDLSGMPQAQVIVQVHAAPGNVCGRVSEGQLARPLPAIAAYQVPATRMRLFVVAFVLAFGFEVWGISALQAQTLKPEVTALRDPKNLQSALEDADSNEVVLRGRVLDVYTREPVEYANVMAFSAGKLVCGTLSDSIGTFELRFPKQSIQGETYQLRLRYQGREREDLDISADIRSFVYLIDASFMVAGLEVQGMRNRFEWDEPIIMGQLIVSTECDFSWRSLQTTGTLNSLYRPLDEWLMMHNSEIHHSGRW